MVQAMAGRVPLAIVPTDMLPLMEFGAAPIVIRPAQSIPL